MKTNKNAPAARNLFSMADAIFSMEIAGLQPYYVSPTSTHARLFNSCFLCLQSGISSVIS